MRALLLVVCGAMLALAACAPRQNRTHFERWDQFAAANPQAAEENADAAPDAKAMKKAAPTATKKKAPSAAPPAPPSDYSSLGNDTPAIGGTKTSTPSRVVKPAEPEDEPIY